MCIASTISLWGKLVNTGNVRLRHLDFWPSINISTEPICHTRPTGDSNEGTVWTLRSDVDVGHEVVCTVSYPIGQDALEAGTADANGLPKLKLTIMANATATNQALLREASANVLLAVSHLPSLVLTISSNCDVPTQEGGDTQTQCGSSTRGPKSQKT